MEIATTPSQLTKKYLEEILSSEGFLGAHEKVTQIKVSGESSLGIGISHHLRIEFSSGRTEFLYIKGQEKAYWSGEQEVSFYKYIGSQMLPQLSPACYSALYDKDTGNYCIFLKDLSQSHYVLDPQAPPTSQNMEKMLHVLAKLHAFWLNHHQIRKDENISGLKKHIISDFALLNENFPKFAQYLGDRLSPKRQKIFEKILNNYSQVLIEHLFNQAQLTLVHNDAHAGNFLLSKDDKNESSFLIDWSQWGVNTGLHDVVYLLILSWYPGHRKRMEKKAIKTYYNSLVENGVENYDWQTCWRDYRLHAIETVLIPFQSWVYHGSWGGHRWHQLEKTMAAFTDLSCDEFL